MRKTIITILIIAATLLAATSCVDHMYDKLPELTVDIPDQEPQEVNPLEDFFSDAGITEVLSGNDETAFAVTTAKETITGTAKTNRQSVVSDDELTINKEDIAENTIGINPGVLVTAKNGSTARKSIMFKLVAGDTQEIFTSTMDPETTTRIFLTNGTDDDNLPVPDGCKVINLPENMRGRIAEGFTVKDIRIYSAVAADNYTPAEDDVITYTVQASYCSALAYAPGKVLKIKKTFKNINFDFSEYIAGMSGNGFRVNGKVTSTIPFDITGTAESGNGIQAVIDGTIAAGTKTAPISTDISIYLVRPSEDVHTVDSATLNLTLTAKEGAKLSPDMTLDFQLTGITIATAK